MNSTQLPEGEAVSSQPADLFASACEYAVDTWQRSILFWDVMRQRGDIFLEHRAKGKPPVLEFEYETLMDGRTFPRPANYALLRMIPPKELPSDPTLRPFVIVDPRAGHGPGIGGFKADSQVGVALRYRHPVYFVSFFPKPEPGQTLRDVASAEEAFIKEVIRRHPRAEGKPCVIGNCQAGWAVASLAALRPDLMGPLILNGAPLAYWSGADRKNPMRYAGGLLGGKWLSSLTSDLGNGRFDGAHLVANFENLNPANTIWTKHYNLYSKIDTEAERFLHFEKWWGAFYLMNAAEIDRIVSDLFIGNKLASGDIVTRRGELVDLRNIRSPIVVFASKGDNITPPQQALNWIVDVYGHEDAIIENGQVIVYMVHQDVGHLGIFVSGRIAKKEHTELLNTLDYIDRLPPGLYEMHIEHKHRDPSDVGSASTDYTVRFDLRTMADILALDDGRKEEQYFETVDLVSRINEGAYQTFLSPWIKHLTTETSAKHLRHTHPMRLQRFLCSSNNPLLNGLPAIASYVRDHRQPAATGNPFLHWQQVCSDFIIDNLNNYRDTRDATMVTMFNWIYGPNFLGAMFDGRPESQHTENENAPSSLYHPLSDEDFEAGGMLAAVTRLFIAALQDRGYIDRKTLRLARQMRMQSEFRHVSGKEMKAITRRQSRLLLLDEERALRALGTMLPTEELQKHAFDVVQKILYSAPDDATADRSLLDKVDELLHVEA
ncbi:MAG: DUF3141 domain-containing protein [Planctomycetota bacterium]|jgi:pimeloyl-ACP methyl ester carboxylesterase